MKHFNFLISIRFLQIILCWFFYLKTWKQWPKNYKKLNFLKFWYYLYNFTCRILIQWKFSGFRSGKKSLDPIRSRYTTLNVWAWPAGNFLSLGLSFSPSTSKGLNFLYNGTPTNYIGFWPSNFGAYQVKQSSWTSGFDSGISYEWPGFNSRGTPLGILGLLLAGSHTTTVVTPTWFEIINLSRACTSGYALCRYLTGYCQATPLSQAGTICTLIGWIQKKIRTFPIK